MPSVSANIDGVRGVVSIDVVSDDGSNQKIKFDWCVLDQSCGFVSSLNEAPVFLTEVSAEHFIRMILSAIITTLGVKASDLVITNHLGENLPDVQFLPPTFEGSEADLLDLVDAQERLKRVFSDYSRSGELTPEILNIASEEGILSDFLSLVQVRASGFQLALNKPDSKE